MKRFIKFIIIITIITIIPGKPSVFAANDLGCGGGFGPIAEFLCTLNPGDKTGNATKVGDKLNAVISSILGFLTILAGIYFLFQFIIAGYQWISSGGDKNNTQAAQDKITNSLIGLIIVVMAWVIIGVIGKIMGLDILNPGAAMIKLIQ